MDPTQLENMENTVRGHVFWLFQSLQHNAAITAQGEAKESAEKIAKLDRWKNKVKFIKEYQFVYVKNRLTWQQT